MENIFSHKITDNEIITLNKMVPGRRIDKDIMYENTLDTDLIYVDLLRSYRIRGDKQKAMEYFNKIKDETLKYFLQDF